MEAPTTGPSIQLIPIAEIEPAEDNFRGPVSDEEVAELTELVKAQGILQPLTVCPKEGGGYKLVFGHRRLRAAALAGLTQVPTQVKVYDDAERLAVMLAENLGRKDLSPLQEARAFQRMLTLEDDKGRPRYTTRTLAPVLGVGQSKVSNYTSIFKLPEDIIAALDAGGITMTQAILLTRIAKHPDRVRAALASWRSYGDMEIAVQRQQDEIDREQARAKKLKELKSTGVRIAPDDWMNQGGRRIGPGFSVPIEPEEHASEPCHAAAVSLGGEVFYVCTEPDRHRQEQAPTPEPEAVGEGQTVPGGRPSLAVVPTPPVRTPEEEAAEAARRAEEEARQAAAQARLEALQTATEGRAAALRTLLAGRQGKGEVTRQFLNWFLLRLLDESSEYGFVRQVLSVEEPSDTEAAEPWHLLEYAAKNKDSLQRAAVAVACDMAEEQLQGEFPNFANPHVQLYYDYLYRTGVYELSDVERAELQAAGAELPEPAKEEVTA
jgi:ParB family chromosome partitioning protein